MLRPRMRPERKPFYQGVDISTEAEGCVGAGGKNQRVKDKPPERERLLVKRVCVGDRKPGWTWAGLALTQRSTS